MSTLVVVESPNKVAKIQGYLGANYRLFRLTLEFIELEAILRLVVRFSNRELRVCCF
jgi:DNA topoisomerase IA